jgi:dTDP-4-dehydrorhamnose reductase
MSKQTWMVVGASGFLGSYLSRALAAKSRSVVMHANTHGVIGDSVTCDLSEVGSARQLVERVHPSIVVNCAAMTNVDECERQLSRASRLNAELCGELAAGCNEVDATLVMISTDQLWRNAPPMVDEGVPVDPVGVYSATKAEGERLSRQAARHLILRTNFFGQGMSWRPSLSDAVLSSIGSGRVFNGFTDVFYTPIAVGLLADWLIDAVDAGLEGTFHLGGSERVSKFDFAVALAKAAGYDADLIRPTLLANAKLHAARPHEMSMSSAKISKALGRPVPSIQDSIENVLMSRD